MKCKSFTLLLWYWAQTSDRMGQQTQFDNKGITSVETFDSPFNFFAVSVCLLHITEHTLIGAGISRGGEGRAEGLPCLMTQ